jgi:hypothetical protein
MRNDPRLSLKRAAISVHYSVTPNAFQEEVLASLAFPGR